MLTRALKEVSDSHSVTSAAVGEPRSLLVYTCTPMSAPNIVINDNIVVPLFFSCITLSKGISNDKASLTLLDLSPSVTIVRRESITPVDVRQYKDVSDFHNDSSQDVRPILVFPEYPVMDRPAPWTVIIALPVPATLT